MSCRLKNTVMSNRKLRRDEKPALPLRIAGLAKSHRLIMIEQHREVQFLRLCEQIRLDDFRQNRSDSQRDLRREKRRKRA